LEKDKQDREIAGLRALCEHSSILFSVIRYSNSACERVSTRIRHFLRHPIFKGETEPALAMVDDIVSKLGGRNQLSTFVVFDADKTLAAEDSEILFSQRARYAEIPGHDAYNWPLEERFDYPSMYALRQATLLCEDAADDAAYETLCKQAASDIHMYPEMVKFINTIAKVNHVGVLVLTCGHLRIWEKVMEEAQVSKRVRLIGAGRLSPRNIVVTPKTKGDIVQHLRITCGLDVWAFGDGPSDILMFRAADEAILVVGSQQSRSARMDQLLEEMDGHLLWKNKSCCLGIPHTGFLQIECLLPPWSIQTL
jgi:phosphoserine phosphatase